MVYIAAATVVVHWLTGARFGFHRDELALLDDARHLAWGYVAYPPVAPFFARISLTLFGTSLAGFRFFAAVVNAVALVLTGLMAHEMGGRRGAQILTLLAAVAPALGVGALMQYVSFDYFCWVLAAYFVIKLLKTDNPRWWLGIGCAIGLGMMSKFGMAFLVAGIVAGTVLTPARTYLKSKWLWYGVTASLLIFLPNLIWQVEHRFVSLEFLNYIHARDVRIGRTKDFLPDQLKLTLLALPLWLAGLWFCIFSPLGKRFRMIGWMYVVPLALMVVAKGRGYYLLGAYPMLYAAGSVWGEQWLAGWGRASRNIVRVLAWTALAVDMVFVGAITLPMTAVGSPWWKMASGINGDLREEIGWPELAQQVAQVRDSLPPEDRTHLAILVSNYGEAGALHLYGPQYGLPEVISGINSYWANGYGDPPPQVLIVLGHSEGYTERNFVSCRFEGPVTNPYGVKNEETEDYPGIFVCRGLKRSWPEFWQDERHFG